MTEDRAEFSVVEFYPDGYHSYIDRWLGAREAVALAKRLAAIEDNRAIRIIVTDGGDNTVFEWKRGKGVTFPDQTKKDPPEAGQ